MRGGAGERDLAVSASGLVPSRDSYSLGTSAGAMQSATAGYVFANPAPVIAGSVAVMVALVAVVVAAARWRPIRHGAVLLADAISPMTTQAISALVQLRESVSPARSGISRAQAAQAGLTISTGVAPAFWICCVFVVALGGTFVQMIITPRAAAPPAASTSSGAILKPRAPRAAGTGRPGFRQGPAGPRSRRPGVRGARPAAVSWCPAREAVPRWWQ